MKKFLSLLLSLLLVFSLLSSLNALAATTNKNSTVQLKGECKYDIAFEILSEVNKLRSQSGLKTLTMDIDLLESAMQRGSEITILYDHIRPNGSSFTTVSDKAKAEIIVLGYRDAKSVVETWKNSPRHNAIMMSSKYLSVGVGAFYHNNELYCVQLFNDSKCDDLAVAPENKEKVFDINLGNSTFSVNLEAPKMMFTGDTSQLNITGVTKYTADYPSSFMLDPESFDFSSSNTSVIRVENSNITAVGSGKATITAKSSAVTVLATVEVLQFSPGSLNICGDNVTWSYSNGVLTISGNGEMYDFQEGNVPYFDALKNVSAIVVEEGVTHIGDNAFSHFETLKSVSLPDTLQSIGDFAFVFSSVLEEVAIPDSVTTLGVSVFERCIALKKVVLPSKLTYIPDRFFFSCWSLYDIEIPATVKTAGTFSFLNCSSLESITLPKSLEKLGQATFNGCTKLLKVTVLNPQIDLSEKYLFENCPESLTIYGYDDSTAYEYACANNRNFESLGTYLPRLLGDVDFDGYITIIDAAEIQLYLVEKISLDSQALLYADVDRDNNVTVLDATDIQLHLAEKKPIIQ